MLDGFPRNLFQAEELEKFAKIDLCLNIDVDEALLMDRICGRRVCKCGESYHVSTLNGATGVDIRFGKFADFGAAFYVGTEDVARRDV